MKVLKFGGGCLKDAGAIKKIPSILKQYDENIIIVISAFGKLTNLLEEISSKKPIDFNQAKILFKQIMCDLSFNKEDITNILHDVQPRDASLAAILSVGELVSSKILSQYLQNYSMQHVLINAIDVIKTSNKGINAIVNWEETKHASEIIETQMDPDDKNIILTQGFISSYSQDGEHSITCLGREGSDYSAAIFGSIFNADEVILFKDVDGIYSTDPKINNQAKLFSELSYNHAFELFKNGNTVIHSKTIAPLKEKSIPIIIKNFHNIALPGTVIS